MKKTIKKIFASLITVIIIVASVSCLTGGVLAEGDADKVLNDNGADLIGTEAEGITEHHGNFDSYIVDGLNNGNFSEGLKWWGGKQAGGPTAVAELKTEGENKYIQFNGAQSAKWQGIITPDMAFPEDKVKAGDKLVLIYDVKVTEDEYQVVLFQRGYTATNGRLAQGNKNDTVLATNGDWKTVVAASVNNGLVTQREVGDKYGASNSGYYVFNITFENKTTTATAAFDNIIIAIEKDGKYYTLDGEQLSFVTKEPDPNADKILQDNDKDIIGTEELGITDVAANGGGLATYVVDGLQNGDFSQGLKWWAIKELKGGPSAIVKLVTEGDNKYIQFDPTKMEKNWQGIAAPDIAISDKLIKAGDTITLIYDYKGTDIQLSLSQRLDSKTTKRMVNAHERTVDVPTYEGDWNTAVVNKDGLQNKVSERVAGTELGQADSGYYTFFLLIEAMNVTCDAGVDNIRLAKVNDDGTYSDIYTGQKIVLGEEAVEGGNNTTGGTGTAPGSSPVTGESVALLGALILLSGATIVISKKYAK